GLDVVIGHSAGQTPFVTYRVGEVYTRPQNPVSVDDVYSVQRDSVLTVPAQGVLTNDTQGSVTPESLRAVLDQPAHPVQHGTLVFNPNDGSFQYTPDPNFFGQDTFSYHDEGFSQSANGGLELIGASATVLITVTPLPSLAVPDSYTTVVSGGTPVIAT